MWIVLCLIAAFIVWHFIPKPDPNRPSPRFRREARAVETDPQWPTFIEEHCESPAEIAFLQAAIKAYDLKPVEGSLSGDGLQLDFQVEEGQYRVDFLANGWLVIEIDGAAWHSSPEAVKRDKSRDEYFESLGYAVVRIPAKVVFNTPEDAVQIVRSALRKGKRPLPQVIQKSGWQRLSETTSAISDSLSAINSAVDQAREVELAMKNVKLAAEAERSAIVAAISMAQTELETADWLDSADDVSREVFMESRASIMRAVADRRNLRVGKQDESANEVVNLFPDAPPLHDNPAHHIAIQAAYSRVAEARFEFLVTKRKIVDSDPRMSVIVEKKLRELGCERYWATLNEMQDQT